MSLFVYCYIAFYSSYLSDHQKVRHLRILYKTLQSPRDSLRLISPQPSVSLKAVDIVDASVACHLSEIKSRVTALQKGLLNATAINGPAVAIQYIELAQKNEKKERARTDR
jgi:hypothetical protein